MKQEVRYLLEIVKYILNGKKGEIAIPTNDMDWKNLVMLAREHSILNFVYYGVECLSSENKPNEGVCNYLYDSLVREVVRSCNQIEGAKELMRAFESEGVYSLVVKGICTKHHYPQTELRTMGDIDILYRPEQDVKVKKVMKQLGYEQSIEGRKHDCYIKLPYLAVEMHRDLVETDSDYSSYYEQIWERVKPKENCKYVYNMKLEDEFVYTIVHLARHFQEGGVGIRFITDVYVYNCMENMDWIYIEAELQKLGLLLFYKNISMLAENWFGEQNVPEDSEEILAKLSDYIISNGTFGTRENAAAVSVAKNGRIQFLWKAVFPNLKNMQSMFPWLKQWPVLLPYTWVLRGVRSAIYRRKNIKTQLDKTCCGNKEYGRELQHFYQACGL